MATPTIQIGTLKTTGVTASVVLVALFAAIGLLLTRASSCRKRAWALVPGLV